MSTELPPQAEVIFDLPVPPDGRITDLELDRVIDHARRWGRCLFQVSGGRVLELILNDNDTIGLHT